MFCGRPVNLLAANEAAEALFGHGLSALGTASWRPARPPTRRSPPWSSGPRLAGAPVRERRLEIGLPGHPPASRPRRPPPPCRTGPVLLTLVSKTAPRPSTRSTDLRSVAGMGRTLAHEIKNPLAGIRGAAQLLKAGPPPDDAALAQLIVDETDRIKRLVDRVEAFSNDKPLEHAAGQHPRRPRPGARPDHQRRRRGPDGQARATTLAAAGLGRRGPADPDLPQPGQERRRGRRTAAATSRGEVSIATAYRHGVRLRSAGGQATARRPARGPHPGQRPGRRRPTCATTCSTPSSPPSRKGRASA